MQYICFCQKKKTIYLPILYRYSLITILIEALQKFNTIKLPNIRKVYYIEIINGSQYNAIMKVSNKTIIDKLKKENNWLTAGELAAFFNVSTRTIRNRILDINSCGNIIVESSYRGYRIKNEIENTALDDLFKESKSERRNNVVRKLIQTKEPLNIYDLADSLYISDSQFERVLHDVKEYIETFGLKLFRKRNLIKLDGSEKNKRRLISCLIQKENAGGFLTQDTIEGFISNEEFLYLKDKLRAIFDLFTIYVNDYAFYTILLHIVVIRYQIINGSYCSNDITSSFDSQAVEYKAAMEITKILNCDYNIVLPENEICNLATIISNNRSSILPYEYAGINADALLKEKYIPLTAEILDKLTKKYCLEPFSEEFTFNLAVHIKGLINRGKHDTYTLNPLARNVKEQYPFIYDMASFIIKEVDKYSHLRIVDDEIAFIAFHIGSYTENIMHNSEKVDCCFIYTDYNNFYAKSIEMILRQLSPVLYISKILSVKELDKLPETAELVISCSGDLPDVHKPVVIINMLISNNDIYRIMESVDIISHQKKNQKIRDNLHLFLREDLFKKDFYTTDNIEMIQILANECYKKQLVDADFVNEVIDREQLSSTSFSNGVAIPHSLNASARKSFFYIVSNSKGIRWGENTVNIIILIGTAPEDHQAFKIVFEGIIELLYEKENVKILQKCRDYTTFVNTLVKLL